MTTRLEASHWLLQQFGLIDEFSEKSERSEKEIKKKQCTVLGNNGQWRTKAEVLFNVGHRYPGEVERAERREVGDCAVTMILPGQGYEIQVNQES